MEKPPDVEGPIETLQWIASQAWRDLNSVYYANTPVWRWLKSGALLFLGLCVWAGSAVVLSVRPEWTVLYLPMAYGFLLIVWGPLTHFVIVPTILRLRRTSTNPTVRRIARHAGKINLTVFLALVCILAVIQPGIMLLEFAPETGDTPDLQGEIECSEPDAQLIVCEIHNPAGFDHAVIIAGGEVIDRADEAPYRLEFHRDDLDNNRYLVQLRDADGNNLRTVSRTASVG